MITPLRPPNYAGTAPHRPTSRRRRSVPTTTFSGTIFRLRPRLEVMEDRMLLSTFLVSNTSDSGPDSLRQAILDSNNAVGATNTIEFAISGSVVQTIFPLSSLPAITNPVLIDGTSQSGYAGTPVIELNGSQAGSGDGLTITGSGVTVRGLDIGSFNQGAGIHLTGTGATGDWIYGNFLGTDPTGTFVEPNEYGVEIDGGAANNLIGTNGDGVSDQAERNLISGNLFAGVWINGQGTDGNAVAGNFIGTSVTGDVALGNGSSYSYDSSGNAIAGGVVIEGGASGNRIGTDGSSVDDAGQGNIISGNGYYGYTDWGVQLDGSSDCVVAGNSIGTDPTGSTSLPNSSGGIDIFNGSSDNTIGGTTAAAGNLITDNSGPGIVVGNTTGDTSVGNQITANRIFANTGQAIDLGNDKVTYNAPAPRQGPNNLQNYPIISSSPDGQLEGALWGSLPDATFRVDLFASAGYNSDGSGEAEDFLGSMEVTTDATGTVVFTVPFTAPAGLPIITATATDPQGNTSEVSAFRLTTLQAPSHSVRAVPNQSLTFATQAGDGIAIEDPDAGSSNPVWSLTLSVSNGTLTLPGTASLTGSGNGTGSLSYSGPLSAVNAALDGLTYTPPAGPHVLTTFTLDAQSAGAAPLQTQFVITDAVFVVDTTADSGPGSLRQAILDADTVPGLTVTIDFAIKGAGVQTIEPITPLPPIAASVLIDGTTQPGFAGMPLIAFGGTSTGSPLVIADGDVTLRGLAIENVAIDPTTTADLIAGLGDQSVMGQLSLIDSRGGVIVQSQGVAPGDANDWINEYLAAGAYSLAVTGLEGTAAATWTIMLRQGAVPFGTISVGSFPDAIVAGDFTGDGHLDLAVANEGSNTVSVLLGNGDGTFQPQVTYAVGNGPAAIVAGDFTGDGHLDLAVTNEGSNTVSVLLGNGDGTFQPQVTYAVGSVPSSIVAGDFTGDGHLDLAVANLFAGNISVLLGNGDGTFQPQVTYAVGKYPNSIVAGDFTSNGHLDLAVVNSGGSNPTGTVSVLLGNGDGTFQPAVTYAVGSAPSSIVAGDFTGDGHLDLAVANLFAGTISVLLGNGDGTFQSQVTYAMPASSEGTLVAGDFTGDGHLDLAVAGGGGVISVLLGAGDGTFPTRVTSYAGGLTGADGGISVAGDFNGDGRLDLAVADNLTDTITVLLGNDDGTFQAQFTNADGVTSAVGPYPTSIVAGDFAGDGRLDLAVANTSSDTISVLLGNGDGTFQPQVTYAVGNGPRAIAGGDFNGDGRLDLAVANDGSNTVSVLLGNGDGTFQPQVTYAVGNSPAAIVAGDFNGDGHLDLAVANQGSNTVSVLLGNGDGTFQPAVTYAVGDQPYAITAGDFTGDGRLDLAVANIAGGTISVLLGNGDGTFQPAVTYTVRPFPNGIVAGDFTGDGRLDLDVSDVAGIQMLLGNGDGTFQPARTVATGSGGAILAGDFTGSGIDDLAALTANGLSIYLGNGEGGFLPPTTYAVGSGPSSIVAGDFNGDGKPDLAVTNGLSDDVSVLLGTGNGTFVGSGQFATTPHATPLVTDVNGDGTDDVLVVDGAGNILYRQGIPGQPGSFEPPVTVNPGFSSRDIAWLPNTDQGPVLASVDADDDAISFYAYRNGGFVRLSGSLATGQLPAQIIAADLNGDGLTDLVVRNAGDGSLSVFFGTTLMNAKFVGPVSSLAPPTFVPPVTLPVGLGVSDVQAIDTTGSGALDLVVTNKLTGQVSVLHNLGDGTFAAPVPYRAGAGLSAVDPGSTPEVTSLDATAGAAAGPFTTGGPNDLVSINPGSDSLDVLAGLGGGRFANPVAIQTQGPAEVVRVADFTGNGIDDLAVLTANGLSIYLGNGQGGFLPPTTYAVPSESDGLTIADLLGNGKLDLLVGDAYGDVLVLLGNGDGTFAPYHDANQAVELAVADLTGNGSTDIIYADQGLDRVVVDYGAGNSSVLANQSTGLLDPGAVKLADLNGDGIPDLIVANSGSNNVLIYPGLGNGQFGPAINDGNGYFVGTNPVGITVANLSGNPGTPSYNPDALPDLVVADKGSNQVSILLNQSQKGGAISFSLGPRLNSGGSGPVSTVVGNFTGGAFPDMLVTNSQSNDVMLLPGVGQGFFNDTHPTPFAVGANPVTSFVGDFNGQTDLVTVNAGSNDLTLISGFNGPNPTTSSIASGGVDPDTAFAFSDGTGFEDVVVGNAGDGALSLFEGGMDGLDLMSTASEPNLPDPTALAFSALTGGQVQFYAATAGRESAELVALSLGIETAPISSSDAFSSANSAAQLVPLHESSLPLVATLLTLTISVSSGEELNFGLVATEATVVAAFLPGSGISVGQGLSSQRSGGLEGDDGAELDESKDGVAGAVPAAISTWERYVIRLDEALEKFQREHPNGVSSAPARDSSSDRSDSPPAAGQPAQGGPTSLNSSPNPVPSDGEPDQTENASPSIGVEAIDTIIESVWGEDRAGDSRERLSEMGRSSDRSHDVSPIIRVVDAPFLCSELPLAGSDRRTGEVLPPGPEIGKDQPDLALTSLVVATLATRNFPPLWNSPPLSEGRKGGVVRLGAGGCRHQPGLNSRRRRSHEDKPLDPPCPPLPPPPRGGEI
jgi:FG-GAP-like repeat